MSPSSNRSRRVMLVVAVLLSVHLPQTVIGVAASTGPRGAVAAATTAERRVAEEEYDVENLAECLQCTQGNCLYCESSTQFSKKTGKPKYDCQCTTKELPASGYCGSTYNEFDRYVDSEVQCMAKADDAEEEDPSTTAQSPQVIYVAKENGGGGLSAALIAFLVILFCCVGYGGGCASMYYLCLLKADQREEQERLDRIARTKVVTAKDLGHHHVPTPTSTSTTKRSMPQRELDDDITLLEVEII
jgi:hypothetical protein